MRLSTCLVFLTSVLAASAAQADPAPPRAAACVAALKLRAEPLAERLRQGDGAAEVPLKPIVTASFAFIGTAYKQGVRQPEADALVQEAEKAQAKLPAGELQRLQDQCQSQGQQLFSNASYFERQFVAHKVQSRIERLRKTS
jgi:hypothetical protein